MKYAPKSLGKKEMTIIIPIDHHYELLNSYIPVCCSPALQYRGRPALAAPARLSPLHPKVPALCLELDQVTFPCPAGGLQDCSDACRCGWGAGRLPRFPRPRFPPPCTGADGKGTASTALTASSANGAANQASRGLGATGRHLP